jgi:hypothetical protein
MAKRCESRKLETTDEVMKALGGPAKVSALTGARYKTVWPWGDGKTFPSRYFVVMTWALKKKRLTAPPSLWGQVTTAEMEKAAA